ncbi:MAG: hypothetical protein AB1716_01945 [Planctomycetota bacterium]
MTRALPAVKCALCGRLVDPLKPFFRASGRFLPQKDPLTGFCDAPLHWPCYAAWPERPRFARHYVDAWVRANRANPFWWAVYQDNYVYISVNPQKPVEEVSVRLLEVGSDIRVRLSGWERWVADVDEVTPDLQVVEKQALALILPELRARFPSHHSIVDAIDPQEKRPAARARKET